MDEKRNFPRFPCRIKTRFSCKEGNPEAADAGTSTLSRGKGRILDLSRGGVFIITRKRVSVGIPIKAAFKTGKEKHQVEGTIVRTGLMENNPSEPARKFSRFSSKGDTYIAVKFDKPITSLPEDRILKP